MRLSRLLAGGLSAFGIGFLLCVSMSRHAHAPFINAASIFLFSILIAFLIFLSLAAPHFSAGAAPILMLVLLSSIYFLLRFPVLYFKPEYFDSAYGWIPPAAAMNLALLYLILGTAALALGMALGARIRPAAPPRECFSPTPDAFVIGAAFVFILSVWIQAILPRFNMAVSQGRFIFLRYFIDYNAMATCGLIIMAERWRALSWRGRAPFLGGLALLPLFSTVLGSRAGFYGIFLAGFWYLLATGADFQVRRKHLVFAAALLMTQVAIHRPLTAFYSYIRDVNTQQAGTGWLGAVERLPQARSSLSRKMTTQAQIGGMRLISLRLSALDPLVVILNKKPAIPGYARMAYLLKALANRWAPKVLFRGRKPFPEALLGYWALFGPLYQSKFYTLAWASQFAYSQMWTLWGFCYFMFGYFGGLAALFSIGVLLSAIYAFLAGLDSRFGIFLKVFMLGASSQIILSFGFDDDISAIGHHAMAWIFSMFLLAFIGRYIVPVRAARRDLETQGKNAGT